MSATTLPSDVAVNTLVQLTTGEANDLYPAWSPDEEKIAFAPGRPGNYDIWVMDSDESNQKQMTTEKLVCNPHCPPVWISWSPGGTKLHYERVWNLL